MNHTPHDSGLIRRNLPEYICIYQQVICDLCATAFMRLCVYGGGLFSVTAFVWFLPRWGSRTLSLPRDRENGNLSRNAHTAETM
jgi:hypothetical protein